MNNILYNLILKDRLIYDNKGKVYINDLIHSTKKSSTIFSFLWLCCYIIFNFIMHKTCMGSICNEITDYWPLIPMIVLFGIIGLLTIDYLIENIDEGVISLEDYKHNLKYIGLYFSSLNVIKSFLMMSIVLSWMLLNSVYSYIVITTVYPIVLGLIPVLSIITIYVFKTIVKFISNIYNFMNSLIS